MLLSNDFCQFFMKKRKRGQKGSERTENCVPTRVLFYSSKSKLSLTFA